MSRYPEHEKVWFDRLAAAGLAVLLLPLGGAIALSTALAHGGRIFFTQERIGRNERPFRLYKFITMREAHDTHGRTLPDAARLTRWGRWLRTTSLDELPQLWNVLRGEMSLVGPRPLLPAYLPLYSARQRQRHSVRPGITGLAQVRGRNALPWPQRFRYDVFYAERASFALDLMVLGETLGHLVRPRGVASPGRATGEAFLGNATTPARRTLPVTLPL
ncbi:MAG: sugar transferase [Catalinimonas sp.]